MVNELVNNVNTLVLQQDKSGKQQHKDTGGQRKTTSAVVS